MAAISNSIAQTENHNPSRARRPRGTALARQQNIAGLALAALLMIGTSTQATDADVVTCGRVRVTPPDRGSDPIVETTVVVWNSKITPAGFSVTHRTASGKEYSREQQYRNIRYWTTQTTPRSEAFNWSGVSVKNPAIKMVSDGLWKPISVHREGVSKGKARNQT